MTVITFGLDMLYIRSTVNGIRNIDSEHQSVKLINAKGRTPDIPTESL